MTNNELTELRQLLAKAGIGTTFVDVFNGDQCVFNNAEGAGTDMVLMATTNGKPKTVARCASALLNHGAAMIDEIMRLRALIEKGSKTWEWRPACIGKSAWILVLQNEPSELVARVAFDGVYYNWDTVGDNGDVPFYDGSLAEAMRRCEEAASEIRPIDTIIRPEAGK